MAINISKINDYLGKVVKQTEWISATQEDINTFGKVSGDMQWIHTDPEKCAKYAPTGGTIVHGIYWVSLISSYLLDLFEKEGIKFGLNYGYDKIRFIESVSVDEEVQMTFVLSDVNEEDGRVKFTISTTIKRKSDEKIVAFIEVLNMIFVS